MTITFEQELRLYLNVKKALEEIPNDYRSQNWTAYHQEIEMRIHEVQDCLKSLHS